MQHNKILIFVISSLLLNPIVGTGLGQTLDSNMPDISQIISEKYLIMDNDNEFVIYYGFEGSFEIDIEEAKMEIPQVTSMKINQEDKSLEIKLEELKNSRFMWIRFPLEMISAQDEKFIVLVNEKETKYDLVSYGDEMRIGMILEENTDEVKIIGTNIIPEFGSVTILVLVIAVWITILINKHILFKN